MSGRLTNIAGITYSAVNWCKKHVDSSLCDKSSKIGTNDHQQQSFVPILVLLSQSERSMHQLTALILDKLLITFILDKY